MRRTGRQRVVGVLGLVAVVVVVWPSSSRAVDASLGEVTTVAGDGQREDREGYGTGASLDSPQSVVVAGDDVYVSTRAAVMRYYRLTGEVSRVAGGSWVGCVDSAPGVAARLVDSGGMAVRGSTLVVTQRSCNAVRQISLATGEVTTLASVWSPRGVVVGPDGSIYVSHAQYVSKLVTDPAAGPGDPPLKPETFVTFSHGGEFVYPRAMGLSADDDALWVAVASQLSSAGVRLARVDWGDRSIAVLAHDSALRWSHLNAQGDAVFASTGTAIRRYDKADGTVSLVAGTSAGGHADGVGPEAWLQSVAGMADDAASLWVADTGNHRLRAVTPADTSEADQGFDAPVMGRGDVSTRAEVPFPTAVAAVGDDVYTAGRGAVSRIGADGSVTLLAGQVNAYGRTDSQDSASARFSGNVRQLTSDGQFLYVADTGNDRIRRVSLASGATSTVAMLTDPLGVWFAHGRLWVSRRGRVDELDRYSGVAQEFVNLAGTPGLTSPTGGALTVDESSVWVALGRLGAQHATLVEVDLDDGHVTVWTSDNALRPHALASGSGHLYVATASSIRRYDKSDGTWVPVAGTSSLGLSDGVGEEAWFSTIRGIAASTEGVFVADSGNERLRAVTPGQPPAAEPLAQAPSIALGAVGTVARGEGSPSEDLYRPSAVTIAGGVPYVAVPGGIQQVGPDGTVQTLAGQPGAYGSIDSTSPDAARFSGSTPQLTTDGVFLYVADTGNARVRRVSLATGATSTVTTMNGPRGVLFHEGQLYVSSGNRIWRVDPRSGTQETFLTFPHGSTFPYPRPAALSADGDALWVAVDSLSSLTSVRVARIDWHTLDVSVLTQDADLAETGLLSAGDSLYAATRTGVRRYDKDGGSATMPAGTPASPGDADGLGGSARFAWIHGLAADGSALYVADYGNDALKLVYDYEFVREPGDLAGDAWYAAFVSDPVNAATGSFVHTESDLEFPPAARALDVRRTYNSRTADVDAVAGSGWSWHHEEHLAPRTDGSVVLHRGDGRLARFPADGIGGYDRPLEFRGDLEALSGGGWRIAVDDGSSSRFDQDGRLVEREQADGVTVTYGYDGARLATAATSSGYWVAFDHDAEDRLVEVTSGDGRAVTYAYDPSGRLVSGTLSDGSTRTYEHDPRGRVAKVTDGAGRLVVANTYDALARVIAQETPTGNTIRFEYDTTARVTRMTDTAAATTTVFTHDEAARLVGVEDPTGGSAARSYSNEGFLVSATGRGGQAATQEVDDRGNVTSRTHADGSMESWTFDATGRVTSHTGPAGGVTTFAYEGDERLPSSIVHPDGGATLQVVVDGLVTERTDPDGVTTMFGYDGHRNRVSVTDGTEATTTYTYDAAGRPLTRTSPLGHATTWTYDAGGRPDTVTDPTGAVTTYSYDAAGNLATVTDPSGAVTTYGYDPAGLLAEVTDPLGNTTSLEYDLMEQLVAESRPGGAISTYEWGPLGRLATATGPTGAMVSYGYDADGNPTTVTDPTGGVTTTAYDAMGRPVSVTDPLGRVITRDYDPEERVVAETDAAGGVTTHAYDAAGRLVETIDPAGEATGYAWTPGGRLASVTDPSGGATAYAYDAAGRVAAVTDPLGGVTSYAYDPDGRLVSVTSPEGLVTGHSYDAAGRVVSETHPDGGVTATGYTARGEVAAVTDPTGGVRAFAYDAAGRMVSVTDANGATTVMGYDERGNRVTRTDADGAVESWEFDAADRLVSFTDRLGRVTTRGHDAAGRVTSVVDASGRSRAVVYDAAGQPLVKTFGDGSSVSRSFDAAGRLVEVSDASGAVSYGWDAAGRLASFSSADGASWTYGWNDGRLVSVTVPGGRQVGYGHDAAGRLVSVTAGGAGTVGYGYDRDGRLVSETLPGGGSRSWQWTAGRLVGFAQQVDEVATSTALAHDAAGRLVEATVDGTVTSYAYDPAGQLLEATTVGGPARVYGYDAQGRRTAMSVDGTVTSYAYDAAGQLAEVATPDGVTALAHDAAGRRVSETGPGGQVAYGWDARGRLASVSVDDGASTTESTRAWDAEDRLAAVTVSTDGAPGEVTSLWWDPLPGVARPARWQRGQDEPIDLVAGHGSGPVLAADSAGLVGVPATDHLGSLVATATTADLVVADGYLPFGQPHGPPDPGRIGLGYRGEVHVGGQVHLRHRDLDSATGTFLSLDPLDGVSGYSTVTNGYHYAHNDPFGYVDPLGLRPWSDADMRTGSWLTDAEGNNVVWCGLATFSEAIGHYFTAGLAYRQRSCANTIYDASHTSGHYTSEAFSAAATAHALVTARIAALASRSPTTIPRPAPAPQTTRRSENYGSEFLDDAIRSPAVRPDLAKTSSKIQRQMGTRGWTPDLIDEAVRQGRSSPAINKLGGANTPATRYVHPRTGQSVVIDNASGQIIHVGGPGFRY